MESDSGTTGCEKNAYSEWAIILAASKKFHNVKCKSIEDSLNFMISLKDVRSVLLVCA